MRGADVIVQALIDHGVRILPGISGNTVLDITDAMYDRPEIKYLTVRHEQVAAAMADGWARATGNPGTFMTHVGPGACQAVVGVAAAYRDSVPMVMITGNQDQDKMGRDQWHELDQLGIFRPICKWSARIERPADIPRVIRNAYVRARTGRPGPVHVDIPKDVSGAIIDNPQALETTKPSFISRRVWPDPDGVKRACEIFFNAQRPILMVGGGVYWAGAAAALTKAAETLGVPVVTTPKGRGNLPEDHPLCFGVVGQTGSVTANKLLFDADVVLAVGARLSDNSTLTWSLINEKAKIIQVDIDDNEMARQYPVTLGIVSDAHSFLESFREMAAQLQPLPAVRDAAALAALPRVQAARTEREAELEKFFDVPPNHTPIKPQLVVREVSKAIRRDAFVTLGSGFHPLFFNKVPIYTPGGFIKSMGLGAMGVGFGQAMGAKLAFPDRQVVLLTGDGDFSMTTPDLDTAVREKINVVCVISNDRGFNSLRTFQHARFSGRLIGSNLSDLNFGRLAEVYGALGERITDPNMFAPALRRMLDADRPAVLDVMTDSSQLPPRFSDVRTFLGLSGRTAATATA
jgi:acetolactate synthase-1/2/3 large subunit